MPELTFVISPNFVCANQKESFDLYSYLGITEDEWNRMSFDEKHSDLSSAYDAWFVNHCECTVLVDGDSLR